MFQPKFSPQCRTRYVMRSCRRHGTRLTMSGSFRWSRGRAWSSTSSTVSFSISSSISARYSHGTHIDLPLTTSIRYDETLRPNCLFSFFPCNTVLELILRQGWPWLCFHFVVCLSVNGITEKFVNVDWWIFFCRVLRVTANSRLDFGNDPVQDADTGIFKRNFYHC